VRRRRTKQTFAFICVHLRSFAFSFSFIFKINQPEHPDAPQKRQKPGIAHFRNRTLSLWFRLMAPYFFFNSEKEVSKKTPPLFRLPP